MDSTASFSVSWIIFSVVDGGAWSPAAMAKGADHDCRETEDHSTLSAPWHRTLREMETACKTRRKPMRNALKIIWHVLCPERYRGVRFSAK